MIPKERRDYWLAECERRWKIVDDKRELLDMLRANVKFVGAAPAITITPLADCTTEYNVWVAAISASETANDVRDTAVAVANAAQAVAEAYSDAMQAAYEVWLACTQQG